MMCLLAMGLIGISAGALAAQTPVPVREAPPAVTGTATLTGRVVDAVSGEPVRKARVRVVDPAVLPKGRKILTDAEGRFTLSALPAGHYLVGASKPAYLDASYGETAPGQEGKSIALADGQTIDRVNLTLFHGGVVAGRVTDQAGEPLPRIRVAVVRRTIRGNGTQPWIEVAMRMSNDLGEFRIFGIAPGEYSLRVNPTRSHEGETADRVTYLPTYYPGTVDPAEAQRFHIAAGQVASDVDLVLIAVRGVRVSGTVVDAEGAPVQGEVTLTNLPDTWIAAPLTSDGQFSVNNVPPGHYQLDANVNRSHKDELMVQAVTVGDTDLDGITITGVKQSSVSGRVVIDRAATATVAASALRITVASTRAGQSSQHGVSVRADFTFQAETWPGHVVISSDSQTGDWIVRQVRLNGVDVTGSGFELDAQPLTGLEVELTNVFAEVRGTVHDAGGAEMPRAWVIVFSQTQHGARRWVEATRMEARRGYRLRKLPAGKYYAVAIGDRSVETNDWYDPDVLERLRAKATPFEIADGEKKTLDLILAAVEP